MRATILRAMKMINSNQKDSEDELGSVFDDHTMKANDKVITTIYCLIFIIGLVCNVSGLGYFTFKGLKRFIWATDDLHLPGIPGG